MDQSETNYTREQVKVIEHEGGHAVVAAVAGSGKTETLVGRVRYLLRTHSPDPILVDTTPHAWRYQKAL